MQLRTVVPIVCLAPLLVASATWLSAPAAPMSATRPAPAQGPGRPILVIADPADPFGRYYAEILRAEGLNEFTVADTRALRRPVLDRHAVVLLAPAALRNRQVSLLGSWVRAGGSLIAMQPDRRLARVLGLRAGAGYLQEGYLRIDTRRQPGAGLTAATMQYHGEARAYALAGAREVARLYFNSTTPSPYPAVTLHRVGSRGGQAAAFAYDLARSVVYTRQGNPAWAGDERDGIAPVRSDDLFYGAKRGDEQPDWVDFDKIAIPQADEQQRLLANLVTQMSLARAPLPRFWYLPRGLRAAVVLTGDDHGAGGTAGQFATFEADGPPHCSVRDWECVRATSYIYPRTPIPEADLSAYRAAGFEIALHTSTQCADYARGALGRLMGDEERRLEAEHPSVPLPRTNRTHCIAWSDWAGEPKAEAAHGIHLDANYYFWPGAWVRNRPGMFTGSGMPMRFADLDGSLIDVYQATTQITDESGMDVGKHIRALLDGALGPAGYYGVFTANMHTDRPQHPGARTIVAEARRRGVPVISAAQLLEWLDGRNSSSFADVRFRRGRLTFRVRTAAGSRGLQAMLPADAPAGTLQGLTRDGRGVAVAWRTIKGIRYGVFPAGDGAYVARYGNA